MAAKRKAEVVTPAEPHVSTEALLGYYRDMLLIRRFEETAGQMYGMGLIGGFCHLYIGEEAVVVGIQAALKEGDTSITSYRDHGHMLACGLDPKGVMAELTGRRGGYSKGKGGSMHMFSPERHFFGGHGIVGAQVPIGTGLGFAHRYTGRRPYLGHLSRRRRDESGPGGGKLQHGALWKLPVLYVIENNQYGMGTSVSARLGAHRSVPPRQTPIGIPGKQVDGMDVVAVIRRRRGGGRARPLRSGADHSRNADLSLSRPFDVRPGEIPQQGRTQPDAHRSTIRSTRCADRLLEAGIADEDELKEIEQSARGHRRGGGANSPRIARSPIRRELLDRCAGRRLRPSRPPAMPRNEAHADAGALADDDRGQDRRWLKSEGEPVQRGRRHRRDRDRQGDDGGRGGRRGRARQDRRSRGHRARRGQHADRGDRRRGEDVGAAAARRAPVNAKPRVAPRRRAEPRAARRCAPSPSGAAPAAREEWTGATVTHDRARGAARRDGRGDAARRQRVPDGRGGRRIPGRLQGQPGPVARNSARAASSTRRSPSRASPGSASARRLPGCGRSSSS